MYMNENNDNNTQYRATSNLNTAIDNPQINVDNVNDVNVNNVNNNSYLGDTNSNDSGFLNNYYSTDNATVDNSNININNVSNDKINDTNYNYEPVMDEKKNTSVGISSILHSKELKIIIFILFLLCIFLLLMPYIYDFIVKIKTS